MALHTLLGANGTIANALVQTLQKRQENIRLVSRKPRQLEGVETVKADLLDRDAVFLAVAGSDIVYLLVGLRYHAEVWRIEWPVIIQNVIDACKEADAKLVFFDNAYMYGKVDGEITETTPYYANSKKGCVRAEVARLLQKEMESGFIKAVIARAVDFYGPEVTDKSAPGVYVFSKMKAGKKAQWPINADVPRSFTYVPDAVEALYLLATRDEAYGQIWHLPSARPITGREFIQVAARYMNSSDKAFVLPKWLLKVVGLFNPFMKEAYEINYQDEYLFIFNTSKFEKAFHFRPTPYVESVKITAKWFIEN
ncbi:nucleoside-diphosphate-sugar epimerase [Pedobacter sp. CAN_A7]|uniref:NAD-dependent epimerase/dehydratase family protein n=1 Tax=Pedobacter sp. CAN_A7 TaxID=2787722 RepID=UPI0018CB74E3